MIQLFHVYKSYGQDSPALVDINLEIEKGEFVFLSGASGAGKSTLLKMIFAAERPTRGQLLVNGTNIAKLESRAIPYLRRNIGVVFQDFKLLARRTVEENVAVTLEVLGLAQREIRGRVFQILKQVGLAHKLHDLPQKLSGGEQQRVAIARALVNEPQILLADEPTGNLDADRAQEIVELIDLANARGTTVLLATHDRELLEQGGRRVITLNQGRLSEH
ncbi:MAG: cell division ATP-binding protein FtsE [Myxococcota bacterium]